MPGGPMPRDRRCYAPLCRCMAPCDAWYGEPDEPPEEDLRPFDPFDWPYVLKYDDERAERRWSAIGPFGLIAEGTAAECLRALAAALGDNVFAAEPASPFGSALFWEVRTRNPHTERKD